MKRSLWWWIKRAIKVMMCKHVFWPISYKGDPHVQFKVGQIVEQHGYCGKCMKSMTRKWRWE